MNIVSKVTVKHLKENKKRTIVTILGIMLSVALIMAISAFAESFLDMMRQGSISQEGEWHALFYDVEKDQTARITGDDRVEDALISKSMGNSRIDDPAILDKPYIMVKGYDDIAMKEYPTKLIEGRYPETEGEIVLPEHLLETEDDRGWKIGDTISLELGDRMVYEEGEARRLPDYYPYTEGETLENLRSASYTIVGVIERPSFESYAQGSYTCLTYLDETALEGGDTVNVAVKLKHVDKSLYEWGDSLAEELGIDAHEFNESLLSYYLLSGNDTIVQMLTTVKWVMMLIVAAGSVAVIYSSFAISISERSRYLGMLASVGATKRQKRNSVFTEAFILGVIGIPLGLLLGFAGVFVTTKCISGLVGSLFGNEDVVMRVVVSWPGVLGAVILAVVTILVSAWIPALRASRITPVEAIRQNKDIKLTSRQVKTSRLTRKLFGFEGELALKNLKRNKKRYRATVLSLVFCIALYLSVASFTAYMRGAYRMGMGVDSANMPDIGVLLYPESDVDEEMQKEDPHIKIQDLEERREKVLNLAGITESVSSVNTGLLFYPDDYGTFDDDVEKEVSSIVADWESQYQEGDPPSSKRYGIWFQVHGLDEESLKAYAESVGADQSILENEETPGVIIVNRRQEIANGRRSWKELFDLKKGDSWEGALVNSWEENGTYKEEFCDLTLGIAGVTEELPLGGVYYDDINTVSVYTTMENALKLGDLYYGEGTVWAADMQINIKTDDHDALLASLKEFEEEDGNLYLYSLKEEMQVINNMLILVNVFVYGFIILTALICITSIFNTISTSMALRRREYAMLKSIGMAPKKFSRMIAYESVFYGLKALLYGLPIGLGLMYLIYRSVASAIDTGFYIIWSQVIIAIVSVMAVVGITMWYSSRKIKKANIVDVLKNENI